MRLRMTTLLLIVALAAVSAARLVPHYQRVQASWRYHARMAGALNSDLSAARATLKEMRRHAEPGHVCAGCAPKKGELAGAIKGQEERVRDLEGKYQRHKARAGPVLIPPVLR